MIDDLWTQYFVDRQVKKAVESLSGIDPPMDFLHLIRKRLPTLSLAELRQSLGRATLSLAYRAAQPPTPTPVYKAPAKQTGGAGAVQVEQSAGVDKTPWRHVTLQDLISTGTIQLPLDIETAYKGHQLTARIEASGNVTWNGTTYDSLSIAGGMARKSIVGAPTGREYPQTNGWTFWRFLDIDGHLAFVDVLRQRHFAGVKSS